MAASSQRRDSSRSFSSSSLELKHDLLASSAFLDQLSEAVILTGGDGKVVAMNRTALDLLDYSQEEIAGKPVHDFIAHEDFAKEGGLSPLLEANASGEWETAFMARGGSELPMAVRLVPLQAAGDPPQHVMILGRDLRPARQLKELSVLHAVAVAGAQETDEDSLIERVTDVIGDAFYPSNFGVLLMDERAGVLRVHPAYRGTTHEALKLEFLLGKGIVGTVAASRQALRVPDVRNEPAYLDINPGKMRSELCVPIKLGKRVLGVINAESEKLDFFSPEDERLLSTVAGQLATAIERVRLFEAEYEQREFAEGLREAGASLSAVLDFDVVLDQLLDQIARVIPYDAANVMLVEDDRARVTRSRGYDAHEDESAEEIASLSLDIATTANLRRMAGSKEPLVVPDTGIDQDWIRLKTSEHFRSWAGAPVVAQGKVLGFISLDKIEPGFYREEHAQRLHAFSRQVGLALQNARLFEESVRQTQELAGLYKTTLATSSVLETDALLSRLYEQVNKLLAPDSFGLVLYDEEAEEVEIAIVVEGGEKVPLEGLRMSLDEGGLTGWLLRTRRPLLVSDLEKDPLPVQPRHLTEPARSWLGIPLVAGDRLIGAVTVQSFRPRAFSEEDRLFLEAVSGQVAINLQNARLFEAIRRQATEMGTLVEISTALRAASSSQEMLPLILQKATKAVGAFHGSIFLVEPKTGDLVAKAYQPSIEAQDSIRFRPGEGVTGFVAETGEICVSEDLSQDALIQILPHQEKSQTEIVSAISLPLRAPEGTIGVAHIGMTERHVFTKDERRLLTAISEIAGNALQRAKVTETLELRVLERTRELEKANESLLELDRLKSDFVSNVSHELRTPITNILLYLDLMGKAVDESRRASYMDILQRESTRLARLIEDLLMLSRIEQNRQLLNSEPENIDALISEVVAANQPRSKDRSITLTHERNPELPVIMLDREQMLQVIANLVSNALAYTSAGGRVHLSSELETLDNGRFVALRVLNTGSPIPHTDLPHLFERFYRGKTGRDSGEPGTGLGLAICREIVERHKGSIEVESDKARTVFTVRLPLS